MSHDWRTASKIVNELIDQLRGLGVTGLLDKPEIQDALRPFNTAYPVHDYLRCRIAKGLGVPPPQDNESEKTYAAALLRLANEDVATWAMGIESGLVLTVPLPITLALVQRQRRKFSENGTQYRHHEMMIGAPYEQAVEKECCILFGAVPLYPYAIRTGNANHVNVSADNSVSLTTAKSSGWRCRAQFWMPPKRVDPARAIIERQTVIADAVRTLVPLRHSIIQLSLDWPSMLAELQSIIFRLESAGAAIDDLRSVKEARPTIDKVKALLAEAAAGMRALRHKPAPSNVDAGLRAISAAMSAAKPALAGLTKFLN
jgi:hypothetical protein